MTSMQDHMVSVWGNHIIHVTQVSCYLTIFIRNSSQTAWHYSIWHKIICKYSIIKVWHMLCNSLLLSMLRIDMMSSYAFQSKSKARLSENGKRWAIVAEDTNIDGVSVHVINATCYPLKMNCLHVSIVPHLVSAIQQHEPLKMVPKTLLRLIADAS